MPQIDVSDVINDVFIAGEPFTITRQLETINGFGESVITTSTFSAAGAIAPLGANSLLREQAFQAQAKSIQVVTTFRLRGASQSGGQNYQPDLVIWKGDSYTVWTVEDYTQYGAGMVVAECMSQDFIDQAPT